MPPPNFWSRIRSGQLLQVSVVYLGASWVLLQVVNELSEALSLPAWVSPVAVILLLIGMLIILATAWVQSHPGMSVRADQEEVPHPWELDLSDAARSIARGKLPHLTWARSLVAGAAAFLLLFGLAGAYIVVRDGGDSFLPAAAMAESAPHGIAVLPFSVRGEEIREWREGMVDLLSTGLDGAAGLRAIASPTVLARWAEALPDPAASAPTEVALEVARRTGARYALLGSAVAIGPRVRVTADVHSVTSGERIGQVHAEGHPDSVLTLVDRLAVQTLALLGDQDDGSVPRIDVAAVTTSSLPALKAYLHGETRFRRGAFDEAIGSYEQAVREDTLFALAYYRLSQSYGWGENIESARGAEALDHAIALTDRLPDRERLLVQASKAIRDFRPQSLDIAREATRKYPDDPEAFYMLGEAQLHVRETLMGWEEAEQSYDRAIELAPRFAPYHIHMVESALRFHADSALLAERLDELERLAPNTKFTRRYRLAQTLAFGDSTARAAAREAVAEMAPGPELRALNLALGNPYLWERRLEVVGVLRERMPAAVQSQMDVQDAFGSFFARGQLHDAMDAMRRPGVPPFMIVNMQAVLTDFGLAVEVPELDAALERARAGDLRSETAMAVAVRAGATGDTAAHTAAVAFLRAEGDSLLAAGDSVGARRARAEVQAFEALSLAERGDLKRAAAMLEEARPDARNLGVHWWLGRLHRDMGNLREAERYFRSFLTWDPDPMGAYELGKVYHALGDRERALRWLQYFVANWGNADPEAQPLVEDAKQRVADLRIG